MAGLFIPQVDSCARAMVAIVNIAIVVGIVVCGREGWARERVKGTGVCICVCVRERETAIGGEGEKRRKEGKERGRERY